MNAERLLVIYDQVADAPDAVNQLRRFVLDLAVRGKLMEHNPADEPASELLKRIETTKEQLGIKHQITPITAEEIPFHLPLNWQWSRIGELCIKTGSGSTPRGGKSVYSHVGVPFFRSQNVYNNGLRLGEVVYIETDIHVRMAGTAVQARDLLLNITGGSMGRCCRIPNDFTEANVSQHVAIIRPTISEMADYLHKLVLSPYFQALIFDEQTGAGRGGLPKHKMDQMPVAVPPLGEQHRIVAKVDELMALCDQLEKIRNEHEQTRDRLTKSSYARLTTSDTDETFQVSARFVANALPALTARADQIKQLRQTILDLAVRGKLVEQDPNDEPASHLLDRIFEKRMQFTETATTKDASKLGIVEPPFDLPKSWAWASLGTVFLYDAGIKRDPGMLDPALWLLELEDVEKDTGRLISRVKTSERTSKSTKSEFQIGDILYGKLRPYLNKVIVADERGYSTTEIVAIRPYIPLCSQYCALTFRRSDFVEYVTLLGQGTKMPRLRTKDAIVSPFPLPSLPEQRRIVAKVDELMIICDQLEANLSAADNSRTSLLESLLHEALMPAGNEPDLVNLNTLQQ